MKYPVIFKTFSVLFSLQSDERWIVPIFGGTIILLLAFSAWRLCTEKKDKWRYRRMMLLSLILWGVGELLWQVNVSQIMIISSILAFASMWLFICQTVVYVVYKGRGIKAVTREKATERRYYVKAQRGKIIVLCLCLIFAMLIISGKASKLGTYLYVRCNYTHLEEFAAEVIQTGAIPDDRYKRRDVRYYPECGMIEFSTFSSGFGSETVYEGFYYSDEDVPCGFQGTSMSFQSDGGGWSWHESDGDNFEYTEKILGKWYWYRMHF